MKNYAQVNSMINLDYICFLRRTDSLLLFAMNDLSIENSHEHNEYLQVISKFRLNYKRDPSNLPTIEDIDEITNEDKKKYLLEQIQVDIQLAKQTKQKERLVPFFEDMENLLCAIPRSIKFTHKNKTNYYYFIVNKHTVMVCVSDEYDPTLRQDLIEISRTFESEFGGELISSTSSILYSDKILFSFIQNLTSKIINRYYIPYIPKNTTSPNLHFTIEDAKLERKKIQDEIKPV